MYNNELAQLIVVILVIVVPLGFLIYIRISLHNWGYVASEWWFIRLLKFIARRR